MPLDPNNPKLAPTPHQLAAYADGELSPVEAAAIEAYLHTHAVAAAEVQALRNFSAVWQEKVIAEPTEWANTSSASRVVWPHRDPYPCPGGLSLSGCWLPHWPACCWRDGTGRRPAWCR